MNPEEVGRILDEIGERVGPAGEHVYQVTVQRIVMEGITGTILGLIILGVSVVAAIAAYLVVVRRYRAEKESQYARPDFIEYAMPLAFIWGLLAIPAGIGLIELNAAVLKLLSPEYSAIYRFIEALP